MLVLFIAYNYYFANNSFVFSDSLVSLTYFIKKISANPGTYIISNFVLWTWTVTTIHLNSIDFSISYLIFFLEFSYFFFSLKRFPWFPVIENNNFGHTVRPQLQIIQLLHRLQFLLYSTYVDIHEYLFHDERDKKNNLLSYSNYTSKRLSKTLPIWIILP